MKLKSCRAAHTTDPPAPIAPISQRRRERVSQSVDFRASPASLGAAGLRESKGVRRRAFSGSTMSSSAASGTGPCFRFWHLAKRRSRERRLAFRDLGLPTKPSSRDTSGGGGGGSFGGAYLLRHHEQAFSAPARSTIGYRYVARRDFSGSCAAISFSRSRSAIGFRCVSATIGSELPHVADDWRRWRHDFGVLPAVSEACAGWCADVGALSTFSEGAGGVCGDSVASARAIRRGARGAVGSGSLLNARRAHSGKFVSCPGTVGLRLPVLVEQIDEVFEPVVH